VEAVHISRRFAPSPSSGIDIMDTTRLAAAFRGCDAVIHAVSYVGPDARLAWATNAGGTASVVEAASRVGSPAIIYVSTASVLGRGPHRNVLPSFGDQNPASQVSASRAAAERAVLDVGGTVVRPNLVYGAGDRWFIPTLLQLMAQQPSIETAWKGSVSTIHVDDLAGLLVGLSKLDQGDRAGVTCFANGPWPSAMGQIATRAREVIVEGSKRAHAMPGKINPTALTAHQRDLLTLDNWFDPGDTWTITGLEPPRRFALNATDVEWYRSQILR
jgi:nucleoside-diphosphate-sugar epimerase